MSRFQWHISQKQSEEFKNFYENIHTNNLNRQNKLEEEVKIGDIICADFKLYYQVMAIKQYDTDTKPHTEINGTELRSQN